MQYCTVILFFLLVSSSFCHELGVWEFNKGNKPPCDHPVIGGVMGLQKVLIARVTVGGDVLPFGAFLNSTGFITSAPYISATNSLLYSKDYEILCATSGESAWQAIDPKFDYLPGSILAAGHYVNGEMIYICRDFVTYASSYVAVGRIDAKSDRCRYVYITTSGAYTTNGIGYNQEVLITV